MESVAHRVVLTGSESTGKTTLAAALAGHYGVPWLPEYVRGYAERKGLPLTAADVEPIARGQIEEQDAALSRAGAAGLLILDTDLLSTVVYAEHYYGSCPEWIEAAAVRRRADLYFLCDIDVPWDADPQRDRPETRDEMQRLFRAALVARGVRWLDLRGGLEARLTRARDALGRLLHG